MWFKHLIQLYLKQALLLHLPCIEMSLLSPQKKTSLLLYFPLDLKPGWIRISISRRFLDDLHAHKVLGALPSALLSCIFSLGADIFLMNISRFYYYLCLWNKILTNVQLCKIMHIVNGGTGSKLSLPVSSACPYLMAIPQGLCWPLRNSYQMSPQTNRKVSRLEIQGRVAVQVQKWSVGRIPS